MAEKKTEIEISIEQKLRALYDLQTIYSDIDRIKTLRGELPLEVQDLEDEIIGLQTRITKYDADVEELTNRIVNRKVDIQNATALITKYQEQINNVRNNREFDHLTKEVEYQTLEIEHCEKNIREFTVAIDVKKEEKAKALAQLEDMNANLKEKKEELEEIVSETRQEEEKLRDDAKQLEKLIEDRLLQAFKRIRKNARNGLAVVYIQRDACGGCFNKIPPQRQLDIRLRKKIIVCEHCGRILVDSELANAE
ncbi:MAG: hypothetical protein KA995_05020 [Paludibacteraceae bacterium]|jgi:predicted  nucleic acid-binding Zn-ribbon protein|nr:hypothetical protein [Paludibacteraceae bacterium]NLK92162.1 hypothetical protein [Bacteroidales bacterium]MBP6435780.1 hypothetical protein [Paludibacteraceae bacterium]MBP7219767.1 hypothetical protein [Paludibacteraceae bacterium]MBP8627031.1 hypothetical protein [Paludibacteraceae bacterium]